MPFSPQDLEQLINHPAEDISAEYKNWIDITEAHGKATIAKACMAMANNGGGYVVLGFADQNGVQTSIQKPDNLPAITVDSANAAIRRYSDPEFHVRVETITNGATGFEHHIIVVPSNLEVPVLVKRDCQGILRVHECIVRKPGPRSEPPHSAEEWRAILNRCVRNQRQELIEAISSVVGGQLASQPSAPSDAERVEQFKTSSFARWQELAQTTPENSAARFPLGYYQITLSLLGAEPAMDLDVLNERLSYARRIRLTGWSTFLNMQTPEWAPRPHDGKIEAWIGKAVEGRPERAEPAYCDYWRASTEAMLFTIRGYTEDGLERVTPGATIDVTLPIWRVGEAVLFGRRLAEQFPDTESILIDCKFTGLMGRSLTSINNRVLFFDGGTSQTREVSFQRTYSLTQIDAALPEALRELLTPLYQCFGFHVPDIGMFSSQIRELTGNNF